ncbi:APP1, partial [Symbiodinium sp. CCMP2592]
GFPVSSIHLCPLLGRDRANFKLRQVTSLLSQFPNRKFILVGDSGERDAEVYAEIMRKHPSQVLKVLIRAVMAEDVENIEKARAAFKGIDEAKWQ